MERCAEYIPLEYEYHYSVTFQLHERYIYRGRIKKYTEQHAGMNHAIELRQQTKKTIKEICAITGVSQAALYRKL
ncbi:helix-turn-helix domain-containing protein [Bacillus cereus]